MSKRVLLADDSVTIQKVVEIILADSDYELRVADNGDLALEKALEERPDIVLADVYMPGKNGYELCSAIKQDASLAGLPVLLLSGTFEAFDESRALAAGADGWIAKPFESQALLEQIEELLSRSTTGAVSMSTAPVASEDVAAAPVAEPDMWADLEIDSLEEEQSEEFLIEAAGDVGSADEVELEADGLWDEDLLSEPDGQGLELAEDTDAGGEVETVDFSALAGLEENDDAPAPEVEPVGALQEPEDEILFLDESDLLIEEEPVNTAEDEEAFEFVTVDEPAADALEDVRGAAEEGGILAEATDPFAEEGEKVAELLIAEETEQATLAVAEEAAVDILPEMDVEQAGEPEAVVDEAAPAAEVSEATEVAEVAEESSAEVAEPVGGLSFFRNSGLISRLAGVPQTEPSVAAPPQPAAVEPVQAAVGEETVARQVQELSEAQLTAIVEQVAGKVIERLATAMLERIAWEVVPDLAESLIKEEISRITSGQD